MSRFLLVILALIKDLKKYNKLLLFILQFIINMANEKKVTTPTAKVDLGAKFNLLTASGIISSRKESIYCLEIFSGKTEKERKAMRKKLRNNRDNFVSEMLTTKSEEKRKSLAQTWKEYATGIYKDIFTIYESNTSTDKLANLADFTQILRKELSK